MAPTPSPHQAPHSEENDTSYSLPRIIQISTTATVVSALFLTVGILGLAWALYTLYRAVTPWGSYSGDTLQALAPVILIAAFFVLLCFAFSTLMRAIAEAIFVITDIEENTRTRQ